MNDRAGTWELDLEAAYWRASEEVCRIFQVEPARFPLSFGDYLAFIHPDDKEKVNLAKDALLETGNDLDVAHRIVRQDGSIRWVHKQAKLIYNDDKEPVRVLGTYRDITAEKQLEYKLVAQAALLEVARDAIILRDMEHNVLFWNKGAERLYGWTPAEVIGRKINDLIYRDARFYEQAMLAILSGDGWIGQLESVTKDGKPLVVECRWTLLRNESGEPQAILAINTDITERKRREEQYLRSLRMESIGTLAGGIAHDLNNLLSPIVIGLDLLKQNGVEEINRPVVEGMERSAKRGASLVKQVLSFSRGVEGARVAVHVGHVVDEVISKIRTTFPQEIVVERQVSPHLSLVLGDPGQLSQALLNLCQNANEAMPGGGTIILSAENISLKAGPMPMPYGTLTGEYVLIQVADTGKGIPKEVIDKIFDPFFTTKAQSEGTGMGLSVALGIIRVCGGFVDVESRVGVGSVFKIYLPVQKDIGATGQLPPPPKA